jgi:hypothetical protein
LLRRRLIQEEERLHPGEYSGETWSVLLQEVDAFRHSGFLTVRV